MLNNNQAPKRQLALPGIPKPLKIILGVVLVIFALIILQSLWSAHRSNSDKPYVSVLARQAEILRVTQEAQQMNLQDPGTQSLVATIYTTVASEQSQLNNYLALNHLKIAPAVLKADLDKNTDAQLQSASQNNTLDSTYVAYAKQNLNIYAKDLQTAYKSAGPNGKKILNGAYDSVTTLLNSSLLKS